MVRVLVTGSRGFKWEQVVWERLNEDRAQLPYGVGLVVVHGDCPAGPDRFARRWVEHCQAHPDDRLAVVTQEAHPADWMGPCRAQCRHRPRRPGRRCPAAGGYRNQLIVDTRPDKARVFSHDDSNGTWDCFDRIRKARIPWLGVGAYSLPPA